MKPNRSVVAALVVAALLTSPLGAQDARGVNGPIRVSADGRYFVDKDGQPFFWLGDTAWPLFASTRPRRPRPISPTAAARASP